MAQNVLLNIKNSICFSTEKQFSARVWCTFTEFRASASLVTFLCCYLQCTCVYTKHAVAQRGLRSSGNAL